MGICAPAKSGKILIELDAGWVKLIEVIKKIDYGQIVINKEGGHIVNVEKKESIKL